MSGYVVGWAFRQPDLTPTQKLVLVALADNAQDDGKAWPGKATIADKTELSRASVYRAIGALVEKGLMAVGTDDRNIDCFWLAVSHGETGLSQGETAESQGEKRTNKEPSKKQQKVDSSSSTSPDVQSVWDNHKALFPTTKGALSPSRVRTIEKALKEFPAADLRKASLGLKQWRKQKDGSTALSAVFATYPGGRPLADHIAFFIEQGEKAAPADDDLDVDAIRREQGLDD